MGFRRFISSAIVILVIVSFSSTANADQEHSFKALITWVEKNAPDLFAPPGAIVQKFGDWLYAYYSDTDTYVGVNGDDAVWVVGDVVGGFVYIDTFGILLNKIGYSDGQINSAFTQQAYIKASNTSSEDLFGHSVSIYGDTLAVGAIGVPLEDGTKFGGAVYLFVKDESGQWSQQAHIRPSLADDSNLFGYSVALSNGRLVVGAPGSRSGGTVYIYARDEEGLWIQQEKIFKPDTLMFGNSVAIDGDTVAVGAPYDGGGEIYNAGAVWIYKLEKIANLLKSLKQASITSSNINIDDHFGTSLALSGDTLVVGAPHEDSSAKGVNGNSFDNSVPDSGAAYIFIRDKHDIWSQQAYMKASNSDMGDEFGGSVAIHGDTVVIGASLEDSSATLIDGDQLDNRNLDSGSAYIFTRDITGNWSQQAYLKASDSKSYYNFGSAVALSNNKVVVGSFMEGKSGLGINSTPESGVDRTPASGSAYLFSGNGASWSQEAYIKASNTGPADSFGYSLSVYNGIIAIGARYEFSASTGVNGNAFDDSAPAAGAVYIFE